jgi:hypothetical protein
MRTARGGSGRPAAKWSSTASTATTVYPSSRSAAICSSKSPVGTVTGFPGTSFTLWYMSTRNVASCPSTAPIVDAVSPIER